MFLKRRLPRALRNVLIVVAALMGLYAVAGFVVVPRILRNLVVDKADEVFGLEAAVGAVRLNPFTLSLRVEDLELDDACGSRLFALDALAVRVAAGSVARRAIVLSRVELVHPHLTVEVHPDSTLNLVPLFHPNLPPPEPDPDEGQEQGGPPRFGIDRLRLTGGEVDLIDRRGKRVFELRLMPLEITLDDFTTHRDAEETYSVSAELAQGGRLTWSGALDKHAQSTRGHLAVEDLALQTAWRYLQDAMGFEIRDGRLGVTAAVTLDYGATPPALELSEGAITIDDLHLAPRGQDADLARLERFELAGIEVDLLDHVARARSAETHGARLLALRNEKGEVEALEYFTLSEQMLDLTAFARGKWQWRLEEFRLSDYEIRWQDQTVDLEAQPLTLAVSIDGASNERDSAATVRIEAGADESGEVEVDATASLNPLRVEASYRVDIPSLEVASAYLGAMSPVSIAEGRLNVEGLFDLGVPASSSYLNLTAEAELGEVVLQPDEAAVGSLAWDTLKVSDARLSLDPDDWSVDRIELVRPRLNYTIQPGTVATGADTAMAAAVADTGAPAAPDTAQNSESNEVFGRHLGTLTVEDAAFAFTDSSVTPPFVLGLHDLSVEVGGPAGPDGTTKVDIEALLDGEAPLLITGHLDPMRPERRTDLTLTLDGYDLMRAQGYAAKYAGWTLKKGGLALNLHYSVEDSLLDGKNHFRLADMEVGEKTDSPDAPDMPLGTAVPIMKDNHGFIDLNVAVHGNLGDTNFNVGKIILGELTGLAVKVVTLPFNLLGKVVGIEGDALGWVSFRAGDDSLSSPELAKLEMLETSLLERPEVRLEIEGRAFRNQDTYALQDTWLESRLLAVWLEDGVTSTADSSSVHIPLEERDRLIMEVYRREIGPGPGDLSPDAAREQLHATFTVTDEDLQTLAQRRAQHILDKLLLSGRLDGERVRMGDPSVKTADDQSVQCVFKIR